MAFRLADSHSTVALLTNALDNKFGREVIRDRISKTFAPTFVAADKSAPGYEIVVADEEAISREESALGRMIKSVVQKYIKYDEDGDGKPDFNIKNIFTDIADRFKGRWRSK